MKIPLPVPAVALSKPSKVLCGAGRLPWPPTRPICPIDLRACPVRVKRALTDAMVNLTYLVHVGCHLDHHVVAQAGADV
jgi:hypothetical protein